MKPDGSYTAPARTIATSPTILVLLKASTAALGSHRIRQTKPRLPASCLVSVGGMRDIRQRFMTAYYFSLGIPTSIFPGPRLRSAQGLSRLSASLRPLARHSVTLTNPSALLSLLRYGKNERKKWGGVHKQQQEQQQKPLFFLLMRPQSLHGFAANCFVWPRGVCRLLDRAGEHEKSA